MAQPDGDADAYELNPRPRPAPLDVTKFTQESPRPTPRDLYDLFPSPHTQIDDDTVLNIRPAWKRSVHQLLEQPTSSQAAFVVHMFTTALIVFSALITVLETVPTFHSVSNRVWFGVETTLVALFTVEYIGRCLAWSFSWSSLFRWLLSFYGIIDLLSVLPYYIELMLRQDTSVLFRFSILRMFRLLRVFRPFRYNHTILLTIEVMYLSVRRSQHALLAIGFFVVMILTVFSTLLYFAERGTWDEALDAFINVDGDPTQFASIPAAAWFVIVTITTVGYGEITPRSFLGRLITLPILVFGLLLITLPSFVLGREFSLVWAKLSAEQGNQASPDTSRTHLTNPTDDPEASSLLPHSSLLYPPPSSSSRHSPPSSRPRDPQPAFDPLVGGWSTSTQTPTIQRDLSNFKLAQNQTELSKQIYDLTRIVEEQGRLIRRLVEGSSGGATGVENSGGGGRGRVGSVREGKRVDRGG